MQIKLNHSREQQRANISYQSSGARLAPGGFGVSVVGTAERIPAPVSDLTSTRIRKGWFRHPSTRLNKSGHRIEKEQGTLSTCCPALLFHGHHTHSPVPEQEGRNTSRGETTNYFPLHLLKPNLLNVGLGYCRSGYLSFAISTTPFPFLAPFAQRFTISTQNILSQFHSHTSWHLQQACSCQDGASRLY